MNFFSNRTTSERFSRRKIPVSNKHNNQASTNSEYTNDSTGSSLLSQINELKKAEEILQDFGSPEDYSERACTCILN